MLRKAALYLRTVGRMKPSMVASRLRGQRRLPDAVLAGAHEIRAPHLSVSELDLDPAYLARFDAEALLDGEFLLINERYRVDLDAWSVPEASHLWNFNLHYFEWGVALAAQWRATGDARYLARFKELVERWMEACPYGEGDAWHPYTISLRLVNWLVARDLFDGELEADEAFFAAMGQSAYLQYRHLLLNQETHLRANHWWENVKTLVIAAAAFGERDVMRDALRRLGEQLDEQILPDGVHFERSLMYHKLVLEGLLRVKFAADQIGFDLPENFEPKARQMLDAMASLERGMGKTPHFNDAADGVAKDCRALVAACERLLGTKPDDTLTVFPDAGYYKLYDDDMAVMFDAGAPGPSYMLGHAHCDCLSFELSCGDAPVVVNAGTYAYQSELRSYFRSIAAHNTCVVDGEEQLECWGEHRVARGYRLVDVAAAPGFVVASMKTGTGVFLRRKIALADGALQVEDSFPDAAEARSLVHFAPDAGLALEDGRVRATLPSACVVLESPCDLSAGSYRYSNQFGVCADAGEVVLVGRAGAVTYRIFADGRND